MTQTPPRAYHSGGDILVDGVALNLSAAVTYATVLGDFLAQLNGAIADRIDWGRCGSVTYPRIDELSTGIDEDSPEWWRISA